MMPAFCPVCSSTDSLFVENYRGTSALFTGNNRKVFLCNNCGIAHLFEMPSDLALKKYNSIYWSGDKPRQCDNIGARNVYFAAALSRIDFLKNRGLKLDKISILDFGAGHGFFSKALKTTGNINSKYFAVESDKDYVRNLKLSGVEAATHIDQFSGMKFDLIILSHVIEHIPTPLIFLKHLMNFLDKHGQIFIEMPNSDHLWKMTYEPHVLFFNVRATEFLLNRLRLTDSMIFTCGKLISYLKKTQKSKWEKLIKHPEFFAAAVLNRIRPDSKLGTAEIRRKYEMDSYGNDRQWLRILAKT